MAKTYNIPDNFIDGGKVFGGAFKTRNFIEGVVLGGVLAFIATQIPIHTLQYKISLIVFMAAPGLVLGITGINNDPLSVFLLNVYTFSKNRKIMLFNGTARGRTDDIVDRMLEQKTPQEILTEQIKAIKAKNTEVSETLVEGVDFIFEDDEELTKYSTESSASGLFGAGKDKNDQDASDEQMVNIAEILRK